MDFVFSLADIPRSRLVKYPLLLSEILRLTPPSHVDTLVLPHVSTALSSLLRQVDMATGSAECKRTLEQLHFPPSTPSTSLRIAKRLLDKANSVKCSGVLRDKRGAVSYTLFAFCFKIIPICYSTSFCLLYFPILTKVQKFSLFFTEITLLSV